MIIKCINVFAARWGDHRRASRFYRTLRGAGVMKKTYLKLELKGNIMIDFIRLETDFQAAKLRFEKIFENESILPKKVFKKEFKIFSCFEFDLIYDKIFFNGLESFLQKSNEKEFTFYTIAPSPEDYFFKHFSKYNVFNVDINEIYDNYLKFVHSDPGNSPADSIKDNSRVVAIYSQNNDWGIIASDDWEIAIVAFKNKGVQHDFISCFDESIYFSTVKNRFEMINNKLDLTKKANDFFLDLILNYD
jgi:hypothetical protein